MPGTRMEHIAVFRFTGPDIGHVYQSVAPEMAGEVNDEVPGTGWVEDMIHYGPRCTGIGYQCTQGIA